MVSRNEISENVSEKLSHPKFETKPPRVLTEMEYRALRDVARSDTRLYSIVELLLQTGIRIGELSRLELDNIKTTSDGKVKYIEIQEFGSHPSRKVPLNASALSAINEYIKIRPKSEEKNIFVTKTGNPLLVRNIRTSIQRAFEKAGIENAKVNDLRNTFIAHHLANGVSLVTVSKLVGHKRLSTTEKYLNLLDKDENGTHQKLSAL
jgi:site-specific recombinase XerD